VSRRRMLFHLRVLWQRARILSSHQQHRQQQHDRPVLDREPNLKLDFDPDGNLRKSVESVRRPGLGRGEVLCRIVCLHVLQCLVFSV
jgi:hypothetical protein